MAKNMLTLPIDEITKELTIDVCFSGVDRFAFKTKIASKIIKFAFFVMGFGGTNISFQIEQ